MNYNFKALKVVKIFNKMLQILVDQIITINLTTYMILLKYLLIIMKDILLK